MPSHERMELIERTMALAPAYQRAVDEENLERLLILRQELANTLEQADKVIIDCIANSLAQRLAGDIERRLADGIEEPLTTQ